MSNGLFNLKKALSIFGLTPEQLPERLLECGLTEECLPSFARAVGKSGGTRTLKSWSLLEMPRLGEQVGFMKKPTHPIAVGIFVTKGGVLKSSLTFNLARMAALHGIRVCVVGLDMQGDITANLCVDDGDGGSTDKPDATHDAADDFVTAIEKIDATRGLADLYSSACGLQDLIQPTDLPTLFYIPETPELVAMEQNLVHRNRREYWLKEKVIAPLKQEFDLILMDCSPNWNRLITNALVASDVLISPLECKINNFRNFRAFKGLINEFCGDLQTHFTHVFVPTRLATGRKLSQEIYQWYRDQLPNCIEGAIRESSQGEEAVALKVSLPEHAPASTPGEEMISILKEIWIKILAHPIAVAEETLVRTIAKNQVHRSANDTTANQSQLGN